MVDLHGKDKGNISLPVTLQSWDHDEGKGKPTIINMQRTFYNIRVADIVKRINRLEHRNNELEEEIEGVDELLYSVDSKTTEEITNLYKLVYAQTDRVENLKNQIDHIENSRIQDKQDHEAKVESFNQRYKKTKVEYVSRIKVLTAEINTLEEFKKQQTALEEKVKANIERMAVNEEKVKEVMKIINRKFEFDREMYYAAFYYTRALKRLKNEMYTHLLALAAKFQIETNRHISLPNRRLMRENTMLHNELIEMSKGVSIRKEIETNHKNSSVQHRRNIVERLSETKRNTVVTKVQDSVLKHLKKKFGKLKEHVSLIKVPDSGMEKRCVMSIENAEEAGRKVNLHLSKVQILLYKERMEICFAKYLQRRLECKIKAVVETLYDLKYSVTCIIQGSTEMTESSYTELLRFLQNILITGRSKFQCSIIESVSTIRRETAFPAKDLEGIPDDTDILAESDEKELSYREFLDTIIAEKYPEKEKSTGSSVFEDDSDTIFEDIMFDTYLENYEGDKDGEEDSENESLM